ncbi:hypothetical protein ACK3Z7_05975 [Aeromonas caviae]
MNKQIVSPRTIPQQLFAAALALHRAGMKAEAAAVLAVAKGVVTA